MRAKRLWEKVYDFCYEFDYWRLWDSETTEVDVAYDVENYPQNVRDYLEKFVEDGGEAAEAAKALLEEMKMT